MRVKSAFKKSYKLVTTALPLMLVISTIAAKTYSRKNTCPLGFRSTIKSFPFPKERIGIAKCSSELKKKELKTYDPEILSRCDCQSSFKKRAKLNLHKIILN